MSYQTILFDKQNGIATITLNRPEQLNTFNGLMAQEWSDAYLAADKDDAVRVIIVTGAGSAFCAGADLTEGEKTFAKQDDIEFSAAGMAVSPWQLHKPVIAALNGHAIGIGLTLALQCDLRIVAQDAKYGVIQVQRGVMPDAYAHWTLQRLVGLEKAAYILLTGKKFTGRELCDLGAALKAVAAENVYAEALAIAKDIVLNTAPVSVGISKKLLWESATLQREQTLQKETELHHHLMGKADAIEGVMAFLEKRSPNWQLSINNDWPNWPATDNSILPDNT